MQTSPFRPATLAVGRRPGHNAARLALDALALALVSHGHTWTPRERALYEAAIKETSPRKAA